MNVGGGGIPKSRFSTMRMIKKKGTEKKLKTIKMWNEQKNRAEINKTQKQKE